MLTRRPSATGLDGTARFAVPLVLGMSSDELTRLIVEGLYLSLWLSAPALAVAVVIGLTVSVLSAATQIQEQSLSYVPKLVGVSLVLALTGSWMATQLVGFTDQLWRAIPALVP
jgi:flagellar biosynthetic protein FliQ